MRTPVLLLLLTAVSGAFAQDVQRVVSPNGQVEVRVFTAVPDGGLLPRLAYLVNYQGKPLIEPSFLGFDIKNQEPMLGENIGLTGAKNSTGSAYNSLVAEYMQNGSLGRRIDFEVRAYNDGIAFRYKLPHSSPLDELFVRDEVTEFAIAGGKVEGTGMLAMPLIAATAGVGFVEIAQGKASTYPDARLEVESGSILITRMPHDNEDPNIAWASRTPAVFPWRAIIVASDRAKLAHSPILPDLN